MRIGRNCRAATRRSRVVGPETERATFSVENFESPIGRSST